MARRKIDSAESSEKSMGWIFGLIGAVLLVIAVIVLVNYISFSMNAVEIEAVVTDMRERYDSDGDRHNDAYITYEYEGKIYENVRYDGAEVVVLGETVTIKVNKDNPQDISSGASLIIVAFLAIFGGVFFAVGFTTLKKAIKAERNKKMLLESGTVVPAIVQNVFVDRSLKVNGRSPLRLTCSHTDPMSGRVYAFTSERTWDDLYVMFRQGTPINVYVMPGNYSIYHVDLENRSGAATIVDFS